MHIIQQIRLLRRSRAARRALHLTPERRQRKDLCLPLVLVRHPRHPHLHHAALPDRHHLLPSHARLHDADAVQACPPRQRGHHSKEEQNGRLVPAVHIRRESGLRHIQGHNARIREQAEPQLPAPHSRSSRRVTSDSRVGLPHLTDVVAAQPGPARLNCA